MAAIARAMITAGLIVLLMGLLLLAVSRLPWLTRLPGDFLVRRGNWHIYIPLAASIIISILLTLLLNLFLWLVRR